MHGPLESVKSVCSEQDRPFVGRRSCVRSLAACVVPTAAVAAVVWLTAVGIGFSPLVTGAEPPARGHGEFPDETVRVGATTREYRLVVPSTVELSRPAPLVVAFHGMLIDSKDLMPKYSGLNRTAERHRFVLAYPNALGRSWGLTPDKIAADLQLFDALVERLIAQQRVDANRIYVLGMSNGGYFAHLLAKERSKKIAAVASHSGPLGLQTLLGVRAERKFPVLIVHGSDDRIFPVEWARENRDKYRREGHVVEYWEAPGLGHAWASDADVNERIWRFFAGRSLRDGR